MDDFSMLMDVKEDATLRFHLGWDAPKELIECFVWHENEDTMVISIKREEDQKAVIKITNRGKNIEIQDRVSSPGGGKMIDSGQIAREEIETLRWRLQLAEERAEQWKEQVERTRSVLFKERDRAEKAEEAYKDLERSFWSVMRNQEATWRVQKYGLSVTANSLASELEIAERDGCVLKNRAEGAEARARIWEERAQRYLNTLEGVERDAVRYMDLDKPGCNRDWFISRVLWHIEPDTASSDHEQG